MIRSEGPSVSSRSGASRRTGNRVLNSLEAQRAGTIRVAPSALGTKRRFFTALREAPDRVLTFDPPDLRIQNEPVPTFPSAGRAYSPARILLMTPFGEPPLGGFLQARSRAKAVVQTSLTSTVHSSIPISTINVSDELPRPELSRRMLSLRIKEQALALGFEKVGVVPAQTLDAERVRLASWLERGYHGGMAWMARDPQQRTDPRKLFPEARSIVVVAKNYYTPSEHTPHSEHALTGKVSRYAWGDDYHDVVGSKLRSLLSWVKEEVAETEGKVCVDIQPMMDKAWAVKAGLGWLGKHANLITQDYGSWVFIGELLLNLELDYDNQHVEDHCGACTLCIEACPTQAITEPYVVDSNKCISYATIELREPELPNNVADNLKGWLYGCDICQDVCPWNRFEQVTDEVRFHPRVGNDNASLNDLLELTQETYAERFRGSAMKRAKISGLQRNARALLKDVSSLGAVEDEVSTTTQ